MPIVEISVVPVGTGSTSVSQYVRTALEVIKKSGLNYELNPMGTCIEGDWDKIFAVIKEIHETLAALGCTRLVTTIKIDDRRDKSVTMKEKVARVKD
ncbi:MTH1187 family thiamine-binding protein [candidate division WOR-3 bacterium]|nr:MTH1187 family thiamine-binding protein [candidate division WOR-3 bacterium]